MAKVNTDLASRRYRFLVYFSIVTSIAAAFFGFIHLLVHEPIKGYFEIGLAIVAWLNIMAYRRHHSDQIAITVVMLALYSSMTFFVVTGGLDNTGIVWLFIFPPIAFFLTGRRLGVWSSGGMLLILILLMVLQSTGVLLTPYNQSFLRQTAAAFIVTAFIVYFYESINEEDQSKIEQRQTELRVTVKQLREEVTRRTKVAVELEAKSADLAKLNQLMVGREIKMAELKKRIKQLEKVKP